MKEFFTPYSFPTWSYIRIPQFPIADEEKMLLGLGLNCSNEEFLMNLAKSGFDQRIKDWKIQKEDFEKYFNRLNHELNEIIRLKFVDYILLVYNIVKFCRENNILNSPGRGSAAGSLVLAVLGCVQIDPIKHNLLFERFISSARTEVKEINGQIYLSSGSLADFDLDSERSKKHLIDSFIQKHFPGQTCNIKTFNKLQGKIVLKECLKVIEGASEDEAKEAADLIETKYGIVQTIDDALAENEKFKKWAASHTKTVEIAVSLNGLIKNASVHAAGVLLCSEKLDELLPVELSSDKRIISSYEMNDAQKLGIKFDNLGLKNLETVHECLDLIGKELHDIDVNDPSIYEFLNTHDEFYGIFQAEDGLGRDTLRKMKCQSINDIALSIAIGRPGSMKFIPEVLSVKETGKLKKMDFRVANILKNTYNCIIYQENLMAISQVMGGFNPLEANQIRKIIGKKESEKMPLWKDKFISGSLKNGFDKPFAEEIWQTFEDSGNYLFNASHSVSYSYLTAICCYLKQNYPKEFLCCALKSAMNEQKPIEEIQTIISEMPKFGIKILPPHILKSDIHFSIEKDGIRFGLSAIKGISDKTITKLLSFKKDFKNRFEIFKAVTDCSVPINILSALILSGAMDGNGINSPSERISLLFDAQIFNVLTEREQLLILKYGEQFKYNIRKILTHFKTAKNEKNKPYISTSRLQTIVNKINPYYHIFLNNTKTKELCEFSTWYFEKELLGYSYSFGLQDVLKDRLGEIYTIATLRGELDGAQIRAVGEISEMSEARSKNKNKYWKFILSDQTGTFKVYFSNSQKVDKIAAFLDDGFTQPKNGDIILLHGQKQADIIFAEKLFPQNINIFTKISEITVE